LEYIAKNEYILKYILKYITNLQYISAYILGNVGSYWTHRYPREEQMGSRNMQRGRG